MKFFIACVVFFLAASTSVFAQNSVSSAGRVPIYPVDYSVPNVVETKAVLDSIRQYYESTSEQKIIDSQTGKQITDFSDFNRSARVTPGFSSEWSYTHGVVLAAFDYIDTVTGDKKYIEDNKKFYDLVAGTVPYFQKNKEKYGDTFSAGWGRIPNFHALDDCGAIGAALIKTYLKNKNKDYLYLINLTADYISNKEFRLSDGTLARHRPQYQSVWSDDMYMSVPFLVNMGKLTGDTKYYDDAVKQILQMADKLYVPEKELFDHGWNLTSGDYDPHFYWARANGWVLMSMVEVLSILPADYKGRDKILHLYRSMVRSLANLQDSTGLWHNLLDKNDTFVETSASAMFTFAIAKGINEGWISHVYGPVAITGWNGVKSKVRSDGAVDGTVEGTTFAHDNAYYYSRGKSVYATHGYGPVLYAGVEIIRLLNNDKIEIQIPERNSINSTIHFRLRSEWKK